MGPSWSYSMTNFECRACGSLQVSDEINVSEFYSGKADISHKYYVCDICKSLSILDFYKEADDIYDGNYYSLEKKPINIRSLKDYIYRILFNISYYLGIHFFPSKEYLFYREFRFLRLNKKSRIVDIGCGTGDFVDRLQFLGYKNASGIDPYFDERLQEGSELDIKRSAIHELTGAYDLIVSHHVLEHVESPFLFMKEISRLLAEKGRALLCFPTFGGLTKFFKEYSYVVQAPQHTCLLSESGFSKICDSSGLKIIRWIQSSESDYAWALASEAWKSGVFIKNSKELVEQHLSDDLVQKLEEWSAEGDGSNLIFLVEKN
jgi:SAM-dependent methyltransferase